MYDANGKLTRAGAQQALAEGGVVHLRGADGQVREYKRAEQLPTEAEFALGDPTARQKALEGLQAQRKQLDEQEQKLLAAAKGEEQARKDADKAQKDREKREQRQADADGGDANAQPRQQRQAAEEERAGGTQRHK